nr:N-acetylmuramoyl-L-alanine amidase [Clostridioides difficile]
MRKYIKHIIFSFAMICLVVVSIFEIKNISEDVIKYMPVTNKTIILDAGHGGIDPGALNKDKSTSEKDINLAITLKLRELIESSGGLVILTREDDSSFIKKKIIKLQDKNIMRI